MKKKKKAKKKPAPFCKNCLLYNFQKRHCNVVVLFEGKKMHPPTEPDDYCIFEQTYQSIDGEGQAEIWKPEVSQLKMWCENPETGEKSDRGIVKIEYEKDSFEEEAANDSLLDDIL